MAVSRLKWGLAPLFSTNGRSGTRLPVRLAALGAIALTLAGCGLFGGADETVSRQVYPASARGAGELAGLIVAGEPRAALVARDILESGGTAADAAAALALSLTVTYPASASLGGGGLCLYYDQDKREAWSIDFLPRVPKTDGPIAVPGLVRGIELMHSQWGTVAWPQLVAPAERLASQGFEISKALAWRAGRARTVMRASSDVKALLGGETGLAEEGTRIVQPSLSASLALLRSRGAADFYEGRAAELFLEGAAAVGGTVTPSDMRLYRAAIAEPTVIAGRSRTAFLAAERTGSGALMSDLWAKLDAIPVEIRDEPDALAAEIERLAVSVLSAYGTPDQGQTDFGSTGFAVVSGAGDAAVCGLTLGAPFGTGRVGRRDGIVLARSPKPGADGLAGAFLAPVIGIDQGGGQLVVAGIGAGSGRAPAAATFTALSVMAGESNLTRLLKRNGSGPLDAVHAVACPRGLPGRPESCSAEADPSSAGLALSAKGD